ncbi:MAG: nucleotidyl transferase [Alphaproteobacteria bacterium]|nr:nucleotidyl transferase [Alphaproteobacteria bacterium]|tara:strand:- start:374027 stop:374755 length:729 start_codon:yes stop_codon:yes gene_type:complete
MIEKAFILAAGLGTRLRPYTDKAPKPMVHIGGKPIIAHTIDALAAQGVKEIVVNTSHLAHVIEDYLKTIDSPRIIISHEDERLETGGGIKKALHHFGDDPFYIINGDALWQDPEDDHEAALALLAHNWDSTKMDLLLLCMDCKKFEAKEINGDYTITADGRATRNKDKNGTHMFSGIRICHPRLFDDAPDGYFSFLELMDKAETSNRLYALPYQGVWHHISTVDDLKRVDALYQEAQNDSAA